VQKEEKDQQEDLYGNTRIRNKYYLYKNKQIMERDFNIHNWQAKFLKEDSERRMTAMEYLQKELPHMYSRDYNYEIADAMEQYAEYLNSFSKLESK